jgi:hypothetical protein
MKLAIRPEELHAAALALSTCASRLDDQALTFARHATRDAPSLGTKAFPATIRGIQAAEHALAVLVDDVTALAKALDELAHHYPHVDRRALPDR